MASYSEQDSLDTQRIEEIKLEVGCPFTRRDDIDPHPGHRVRAPTADALICVSARYRLKLTTNLPGQISKQWPPDNALSPEKPSFESPSPSDLPSSIPPRHDRFGRRSSCLNIHPIPRLTPTRSFPVTRTPNASHNFRKMNQTFAAFDGGDTQPMDSQIYKEHTKRYARTQDSWDNGESYPPETYREGDAGHVDLFSDLVDGNGDDETRQTTQASYSEGLFSDSPFRTQTTSHPTRLLPPQTPALPGKQRDNNVQTATSAAKTPGSATVAPGLFNNGTGVPTLSMSQVFSNSQQFTSPQIDSARSDPVRPSPNINMRLESDAAPLSSPSKMVRSQASRAASEPRDGSMPMREPRETRYRHRKMELEERLERLNKQSDDEYEDELAREQRKAEQRGLEKQIHELTAKCDAAVDASGGLRARRRGPFVATKSDTALFTPTNARAKQDIVEISDDTGLSDDSEDELVTEPPTVERSFLRSRVEVPKTSSHGVRASQDGVKGSPTVRASQDRSKVLDHDVYLAGGDDVAVADSQPHRPSQQDSNRPPPPVLDQSSLDTRIAQSQFSVLSAGKIAEIEARAQRALDTSSVPRPPPFSSQAVEQGVVDNSALPSSPPLMATEHSDEEISGGEENDEDGAANDDFDKPDYGYDFDGGLDYIESSPRPEEGDDDFQQPDEDHDQSDDSGESDAGVEEENQVAVKPDGLDAMVTENQDHLQEDDHMEDNHIENEREEEAHGQKVENNERLRSTIPDTDPDGRDCSDLSSQIAQELPATSVRLPDKPETADRNDTTDSNGTPLFSTARTHNSGMESPQKSQPSPAKPIAQPTPQATRPVRLLTEIAAEPSQRHEEVEDIEISMDILDDDDKEFAEIMSGAGSSPFRPAKRLKTYSHRALRESPKKANRIPERSPTPKSPLLKSPMVVDPRTETNQGEETVFAKPAIPKAGIFLSSPSKQAKETPTKPPQARSIKARRVAEVAETPQVSTKRAPAKTTKKTPTSRGRKKSNARTTREEQASPVTNNHVDSTNTVDAGIEVDTNSAEQAPEIVAPERVLARFKGYAIAYYPATCLSAFMANRIHCKIRFDDGTEDTLEDWEVRRCELRIGDLVKVDLPNMRTKNYIVRGFKDRLSAKEVSNAAAKHIHPATDVYGAKTVVLEVKRRDSMPQTTNPETVDVPVASVYLTNTMWPHFKDREYKPTGSLRPDLSIRPQTPSTNLSAPGTPTTLSRRQVLPTPGTSVQRPIATPSVSNTTGLFAGMAFALTWHGDEREKTQVIKQITINGGQVLESGFEVLFNGTGSTKESGIETPRDKSTPKSTSRRKSTSSATPFTAAPNESQPLTLTTYANSLSFVALISDRHSRRTKYIQALALFLPCLSHHWLTASLSRKALVPWSLYLLPAGESVALGGAVRSRVIEPLYEAGSDAGRLVSVLERRKKLLEGMNVVLVVKQRSRGTAYEFLTRVMGARRVKGCTSVVEARKALVDGVGAQDEEGHGWDWVYVDGGDVEGAVKVFEGGDAPPGASSRGKKRKRESDVAAGEEVKADAGMGVRVVDMGGGQTVKVVGDEFVVQSLILGALLE
ncbi:hypothetical protein IWZ01DRAFT_528261 [Phyllosticta capitalensis]